MQSLVEILGCRDPADSVIETPERLYSVADVTHSVQRFCEILRAENIRRIALLADNSADWIIADLACQVANICLVPLPAFFSDSQLTHSLASVGVDALLTDDVRRCHRILLAARITIRPGAVGRLTLLRLPLAQSQPLPEGTQKVTFTSGSTGAPRGVCLAAAQQLRVVQAVQNLLQFEAPRHLCLLPLSTLLENVCGVYWPLLANGTVIVSPGTVLGFSGGAGFDLPRLIENLERHRPTSIILLPQMLVGLVSLLEAGWRVPRELRFAAVGGARVDAGLLLRARRLGMPVYEGYGLSETGSVCCLNGPDADRPGSAGYPLAHLEVTVDDGEVIVSGNTFLGYVDSPDSWGQSRVATGDLGHLDKDGFVHIEGRRKNLLISSLGRNVSPEWIESQLLAHRLITQCVVLGDDRPYCTALIVPADSAIDRQSLQALIERVNLQLPDYARIHRWHCAPAGLNSDPALFTANGKPRRTAITRRFATEIEALYAPAGGEVV